MLKYKLILLIATFIGGSAFSADGDLDLTYDTDGINSVSFGASDVVYGGSLQNDGKLIVVGGGRPVNATQEFGVARFNADGSIDTGFGTSGKYYLDITTTSNATDRATCAGVQSDGKIIVGGYTRIASGNEDFALIRLTSAGALDTTFGTSGVAKVNFNNAGDRATDLVVLSDNSILICGNVFTDTIANGGKSTYGVAKLTSAGVLDTTFGSGGKAAINVGASDDSVGGMDVQSDGKILIAGASDNKATIVRFTAAGVADTTFGTNGVFSRNLGASTSDTLYDVKFETGGNIVACGSSAPSGTLDVAFLRVTSAGVLDTTFNTTGYLVNNLGSTSESMRCLVIQSDGKYLAGGFWTNGSLDAALLRASNAGVLDTTFGTAGIKKVSVAAGSDQIMALFVGADSKIVAAVDGAASSGQEDFYAARFQNTIAASEVAPTVTTAAQTNVTHEAADLGGNVTADGGASVTDRGIVWATTSEPTIVTGTKVAIGSGTGTFSTTVSSLPASTLIYVRAYATNTIDTSYGNEISFTTLAAPAPEIAVSGNSVEIPDGDTTPQGADYTSFGSVFVTGGTVTRSFTITNTGAGQLNLTGTAPNYVTLSGDTTHFSITAQPATPVTATNGTTSFTVRFDPTSVGVKDATVTILSNDADESPYTFAITGTGTLQPGNLDITLDTDGRLTTNRAGASDEEAYAVAVQPDGKILVGGYGLGLASATDDFMIVRYNVDGSLDTTWDMDGAESIPGGIVTTDLDEGADVLRALKVLANGKVLAAGYASRSGGDQFALVRYNADGTLDTDFGSAGKVFADFSGDDDQAVALAVQADGKILLAGRTETEGTSSGAIVRFTTTGELDTSFGTSGMVETSYSTFGGEYTGIAVQPVTNRILAAGFASNSLNNDIVVDGYDVEGALDPLFGVSGSAVLDMGYFDEGRGIAVRPDGSILVVGTVNDGSQTDLTVLGFTAAGEPDYSFGYSFAGGTTLDLSGGMNDQGLGIALRSDGKIAVIGQAGAGEDADFGLVVLSPEGVPDESVSGTGIEYVNFFSDEDTGRAIAWDAQGYLVAVGGAEMGATGRDFAVARLVGPELPVVAQAPEITVFGGDPEVEITHDDDTPSAEEGSAFTSTTTSLFTIHNDGDGPLTNLTVTLDGPNAGDFVISADDLSDIAPGESREFGITFDPLALGLREATVHIGSNDTDENPFSFKLSGNATILYPLKQTDPLTNGLGAGGGSNSVRGWRFKANIPVKVFRLGSSNPLPLGSAFSVSLWSVSSQTQLAKVDITSTGPAAWQWQTLPAPITLSAGSEYIVSVFSVPGNYYLGSVGTRPIWTPTGDIQYLDMRYANSANADTYPNQTLTNYMYGVPDIGYVGGAAAENAPPTDITLTPSSIAENNSPGATVGTLAAVDPDAGDTRTFTLVAGEGDTDNASFTISGTALKLTPVADYETKSSYSIRINVNDGSDDYAKALVVTVTNVNEAPSFKDAFASHLLYETVNPTRVSNNIVYAVNNAESLADTEFNRVRYRMELNVSGTLRYADVAFDAWDGLTLAGLKFPDQSSPTVIKDTVLNMTVESNYPGVVNGTEQTGHLEIWPSNYGPETTFAIGGSSADYDFDDSGFNTSIGFGSFQVHNLSSSPPQTVLAWNQHNSASPDIGFGNKPSGSPDWTFDNGSLGKADWKLQIYIEDTLAISSFLIAPNVASNLQFPANLFIDDSASLTVTLSIEDGVIIGNSGSGVTIGGTAVTRTFTGSVAALNTYFATAGQITYQGALNNIESRTLSVVITDGTFSASTSTTINFTALPVPEPVPSLLGEDVVTNGAAPGADGSTEIGKFDLLRRGGFLAENGNLVFPGFLLVGSGSPAVTAETKSGLWKTSGGNLFLLARTGTTVPDVPGALFATLPEVPGISEEGEVSFLASLVIGSGGVTTANDTGLWSDLGGSGLALLMREDDDVPGLSGVKVDKFASGVYATATTDVDSGEAAFSVTYKGTSTKTAILRASIEDDTTTVSVIAQEGETAPGVTPAATFANLAGSYSDPGRMDANGNFAFAALTTPGSKEGIWYQPLGGSITKVFGAGDTAPGTGGATFLKLYRPSMGSNGFITFRGALNANGDNSANLRNDGIWAGTVAGGFNSILRRGDGTTVVSNLPGVGKVGNVWGGWVANSNLGAWKAWLDVDGNGTSAAPTDVNAIYTNLSGSMLLAVKVGDAAPGTAETFTGFDLPVVGGSNQYAFLGTLSGATATNQGLWKSSANGGAPVLVLRKGDTVDTTEGPQVVVKIDLPGSNQTDRRWEQQVMDDTGRMVIYITFADGLTSQILVP